MVGDVRLLRFLRGHGKVGAAARYYKAHLAFRAANDVDAMRDKIVAEDLEYADFPGYSASAWDGTISRAASSPPREPAPVAYQSRAFTVNPLPRRVEVVSRMPFNHEFGLGRDGSVLTIQWNGRWDTVGLAKDVKKGEKITREGFIGASALRPAAPPFSTLTHARLAKCSGGGYAS